MQDNGDRHRRIARQVYIHTGSSLAELSQNSFRLEVTISDETNTREQKKTFQKTAFDLLSEILGNVHPHSTIWLIDCRSTIYGYGGMTHAERLERPGNARAPSKSKAHSKR